MSQIVYYKKKPREGFFLRKNYHLHSREITQQPMPQYFKDVRAEMKHVSWPTRSQTIAYTVVVIVASLGTAVYLGMWDYLFSAVIRHII